MGHHRLNHVPAPFNRRDGRLSFLRLLASHRVKETYAVGSALTLAVAASFDRPTFERSSAAIGGLRKEPIFQAQDHRETPGD